MEVLLCTFYKMMPRVLTAEGNPLIPHTQTEKHALCFYFCCTRSLVVFFFLIPKITGLCLVSCAVSFSLGTAEGGSH